MRSESGFTLVELVTASLVGAAVLLGFTGFYLGEQRMLLHHQRDVEATQDLSVALEQISRDLRASGYGGGAALQTLGASRVIFTTDFDHDGTLETRQFCRAGAQVLECDGSAASCSDTDLGCLPLAGSVDAFTLAYRDRFGATTTNPACVKSIDVLLRVRRTLGGRPPVVHQEVETVERRNPIASTCP